MRRNRKKILIVVVIILLFFMMDQGRKAKLYHQIDSYLDQNPNVKVMIDDLDEQTKEYFYNYLDEYMQFGRIYVETPERYPDDPPRDPAITFLSDDEIRKYQASKLAHGIYLDMYGIVGWKLNDYNEDELDKLFGKRYIFRNTTGSSWGIDYAFFYAVDYSPSDTFKHAMFLIGSTQEETIKNIIEYIRQDTRHIDNFGAFSEYFTEPPRDSLTVDSFLSTYYSHDTPYGNFNQRVSLAGCQSTSGYVISLLRSLNIPGYRSSGMLQHLKGTHKQIHIPIQGVIPHADDVTMIVRGGLGELDILTFSDDLGKTPVNELFMTWDYYNNNIMTCDTDDCLMYHNGRFFTMNKFDYPSNYTLQGICNNLINLDGFISVLTQEEINDYKEKFNKICSWLPYSVNMCEGTFTQTNVDNGSTRNATGTLEPLCLSPYYYECGEPIISQNKCAGCTGTGTKCPENYECVLGSCEPTNYWSCDEWSECIDDEHTKTCQDVHGWASDTVLSEPCGGACMPSDDDCDGNVCTSELLNYMTEWLNEHDTKDCHITEGCVSTSKLLNSMSLWLNTHNNAGCN